MSIYKLQLIKLKIGLTPSKITNWELQKILMTPYRPKTTQIFLWRNWICTQTEIAQETFGFLTDQPALYYIQVHKFIIPQLMFQMVYSLLLLMIYASALMNDYLLPRVRAGAKAILPRDTNRLGRIVKTPMIKYFPEEGL